MCFWQGSPPHDPTNTCNHCLTERALHFQESVDDLSNYINGGFIIVTCRFLNKWLQTRIITKDLVPNFPGVLCVVLFFVKILG